MATVILLIASFFVAFLVVLGSAPMLRRIAWRLRPEVVLSDTTVGVGGAMLVAAILLDSFYLLPLPIEARRLVIALVVVLVCNGLLWWRLPASRARSWRNLLGPWLILMVVVGVIGLPAGLVFDSTLLLHGWFGALLTFAFVATLTFIPIALAALAERHPAGASLNSPYLVVPAMLGIMSLSLNAGLAESAGVHALDTVLHVFLPCLGAMAGISFYRYWMPWRSASLVAMGASGQMISGLICGWAAIQIAAASPRPGTAMVATLWMMVPVLFEVAREQIRRHIVPDLDPGQVDSRLLNWLQRRTPPAFIYATTILMTLIGMSIFWSPFVRVWAAGVALPFAFAAYLVLGGWLGGIRVDAVATETIDAKNG